MSDEGFETFEVSPTEEPEATPVEKAGSDTPTSERSEKMAESQRCLHVTIIDHNPVIEGTDDSSYVDMRIPLGMVETGLKLIPKEKLGDIDPEMIVQMIEMGAQGELVSINGDKKSVSIRVE